MFVYSLLAYWTMLVVCTGSGSCLQDDIDIANWVDDETAVVIEVGDVSKLRNAISKLSIFDGAAESMLQKLFLNEEPDSTDDAELHSLMELFELLTDTPSGIGRLTLFIHPSSREDIKFSVVIKPEKELAERTLELLLSFLEGVGESKFFERLKPASLEQAQFEHVAVGTTKYFGLKYFNHNNHIVFSNNEAILRDMVHRTISPPNSPGSLARHRSYRHVRRITRKNSEPGSVFLYVNPETSRSLFKLFDESDWDMYELKEFRAIGAVANLFTDHPSKPGVGAPCIFGSAIIAHSLPAPTYMKILDSYLEYEEIPPFAFRIKELNLTCRDAQKYFEAKKSIYDAKHGEGEYEKTVQKRYANNILDYFADVLPRTNHWLNFKYEDRFGANNLMSLQKVKQRDAMQRYVAGVVEMTNRSRKRYAEPQFERRLIDETQFWALSIESLQTLAKKRGRDLPSDVTRESVRSESYALDSNWFFMGDMFDVQKQIDLMADDAGENYSTILNDRIKALIERTELPSPFKIQISSPWLDVDSSIERFVISHIKERYRVDDDRSKRYVNDLVRQNRIGFPLETEKDRRVAMIFTVVRKLTTFLDQQIVLYAKTDGQIRVAFAYFEKPKN